MKLKQSRLQQIIKEELAIVLEDNLGPGLAVAAAERQEGISDRASGIMQEDDTWIQDAEDDIEDRGTEGVCTGDKFGGPTCKPGTKRYNLAKTFRKMAKKKKS